MKNEKLNELFESWENSNPEYIGSFKKDGIIDEVQFEKQDIKVLFVAKEPNEPDQFPGDNRKWFLEGNTNHMICKRIYEWGSGILTKFPPIQDLESFDTGKESLFRKIAFMNLKKNGGGSTSNYNKIRQNVKNEREFILNEFSIIDPSIIIGCINSREIWEILFPGIVFHDNGFDVGFARINGRVLIDFYHPSLRAPRAMSYALLRTIMLSQDVKNL